MSDSRASSASASGIMVLANLGYRASEYRSICVAASSRLRAAAVICLRQALQFS